MKQVKAVSFGELWTDSGPYQSPICSQLWLGDGTLALVSDRDQTLSFTSLLPGIVSAALDEQRSRPQSSVTAQMPTLFPIQEDGGASALVVSYDKLREVMGNDTASRSMRRLSPYGFILAMPVSGRGRAYLWSLQAEAAAPFGFPSAVDVTRLYAAMQDAAGAGELRIVGATLAGASLLLAGVLEDDTNVVFSCSLRRFLNDVWNEGEVTGESLNYESTFFQYFTEELLGSITAISAPEGMNRAVYSLDGIRSTGEACPVLALQDVPLVGQPKLFVVGMADVDFAKTAIIDLCAWHNPMAGSVDVLMVLDSEPAELWAARLPLDT